jgi:hypothetical protein
MRVIPIAALALALAGPPAERELAFQPAAGATLQKTFTERTSWTLDSMTMVYDGAEVSMTPPELTGVAELRLVVRDTYGAVDGGVPLVLLREFETVTSRSVLELEVEGASEDLDLDLASEIEGEKVVFTRETPGDEAEAKFEGEEHATSELLRGLREDLDLRGFLPAEDVGVEDWWEVDVEQLADVLAPGGDLALAPGRGASLDSENLQPDQIVAAALVRVGEARDGRSGEATLTWKETKKEGERELASIAVEIGATAKGELSGRLRQLLAEAGAEADDRKLAMEWAADGEGTLVWDLTADRFESLELALDVEVVVDLVEGSGEDAVSYRFALSGKTELAAAVEAK